MALKGRPCFLLLIVACAVLAAPSDAKGKNRPNYKSIIKKMIAKCHEKEYAVPQKSLSEAIFTESNMPIEGRDGDRAETLLSSFLDALNSSSATNTTSASRPPKKKPNQVNKALKCLHLSMMLKKMRNTTEAPACYFRAFMAPVALNSQCENEISSSDYEAVLWGAKPMMKESPSARMNLPTDLDAEKMKQIMKMLQDVYSSMDNSERTVVAKWAKDQIIQNTANCTMKASSDPKSRQRKQCGAPEMQLSFEGLTMMGRFASQMTTDDFKLSSKEKICDFLRSKLLNSMKNPTPTQCKRFLKIYRACYNEEEFLKHLDELGSLTCCLNIPNVPFNVSGKVLAQLENCDNFMTKNMKKLLVRRYMSANASSVQALINLGKNARFLAREQFLSLNPETLKRILKNWTLQWTPNQQCMLVKKQLGDKCNETSYELKDVQSLAKALPVCILKHLKVDKILKDPEVLRNISRKMRKGQLKAMLQKLPPEVLKKMPGPLACAMSHSALKRANITSLELAENKTWCPSQAAYLAKMIKNDKEVDFRKLRSVLRGVPCKMIEKAADIKKLAEAMAEAPQWLSKTQVICTARKLFAKLEEERKDFFKTISEDELARIQTEYLLHLPPQKLKDLPEEVCPMFLEKLEKANLSLLPLRAWSRPALISRALRCLGNETDLSDLALNDVSFLGPLVCDLPPAKLALMAPDVLNATLERMADCEHIPISHQKALTQLVKQTYGDPSGWTDETAEKIIPLLDDDEIPALPKKTGMKDVVYYVMMLKRRRVSKALKKKWFELVTDPSTETTPAPDSNKPDGQRNSPSKPTEELIEELGMNNCYWTPSQLDTLSKETFQAAVETLGTCPEYSAEQLAVLRRKAIEAFGSVSQIAECQVQQMGCITQGFSDADLETLPFSLDSMEEISGCAWTESQMKSVWRGIAKRNDLKAPQLGAAELVALSRFVCGLNGSEIQQLNMDAFRDAVGSMNGIRCDPKTMQRFKRVAVAAFGAPSTWDDAQISELSNIIPGLDASELASLDPSVFSFVDEAVIPQIPPGSLKELSEDQLRSFGPDNAAVVTSAQLDELSVSQHAALNEAATGSRSMSESSENSAQISGEKSGAPSLDVEGIPALMKPVLFLCMGFLLL